jgi:hypothetical protein
MAQVEHLLDRIERDLAALRRLMSEDPEARATGCRVTKGSHGVSYVRDPLGTDVPPADWPFPAPSRAEVAAATKSSNRKEGELHPLRG